MENRTLSDIQSLATQWNDGQPVKVLLHDNMDTSAVICNWTLKRIWIHKSALTIPEPSLKASVLHALGCMHSYHARLAMRASMLLTLLAAIYLFAGVWNHPMQTVVTVFPIEVASLSLLWLSKYVREPFADKWAESRMSDYAKWKNHKT